MLLASNSKSHLHILLMQHVLHLILVCSKSNGHLPKGRIWIRYAIKLTRRNDSWTNLYCNVYSSLYLCHLWLTIKEKNSCNWNGTLDPCISKSISYQCYWSSSNVSWLIQFWWIKQKSSKFVLCWYCNLQCDVLIYLHIHLAWIYQVLLSPIWQEEQRQRTKDIVPLERYK